MNNKDIKPFIKWAGGKRQLLPEINKYKPQNIKRYFEPFIGGGAVFFDLQNEQATINDYNADLINVYECVKNNVDELIALLEYHREHNSKEYYYELRSWDRSDLIFQKSNVEKAARFIYLNKTGFNGLYRVNSKNQLNVPYGKYKNPSIFDKDSLIATAKYLKDSDITILTGDFADAVLTAKKDDFVYFDPPYAPIETQDTNFVSYTDNGFGIKEQTRLRDLFIELDSKGVNVMMSNSSVPLIHELYARYSKTTKIVQATRAINSKASGRGKVDEVLVMNYDYQNFK